MHNTSLGGHIQAMGGVSRATADEQRADGGAGRSFANGTEQRSSILDGKSHHRYQTVFNIPPRPCTFRKATRLCENIAQK